MSVKTGKWGVIGWEGINFEVPVGWDLGAISGDNRGGYLRVDDEEMPRVEVRWESPTGTVDVGAVIKRYFKDLKKRCKRRKIRLEFEPDVKLVSKRKQPQKNLQGFAWRGDRLVYGLVWYCHECGRLLISQILGKLEEDMLPAARRIFESLRDHPQAGWKVWSFYDFYGKVPSEYQLEGKKLLTGYIELTFKWKKRKLNLARFGIANVLLGEDSLYDWYKGKHAKKLRGYKFELMRTELKGHEGIVLAGRRRRRLEAIWRVCEKTFRLKPPIFLEALIWHCRDFNKIFLVELLAESELSDLLAEICSGVRCH